MAPILEVEGCSKSFPGVRALEDVRLKVLPGEAFPADGIVIDGDTMADEALLTGESRPVPRPCGARDTSAGCRPIQNPGWVPSARYATSV